MEVSATSSSSFSYLVIGVTYAFAAAVQPGPLQAYLVSQTLANGWRRTIPAVFAPILSDIPIVVLVLLVLTQVSPSFVHVLQLAGGFFLLYLAVGAFNAYRNYQHPVGVRPTSVPHTIVKATLVNLLNPNPYLGWTLIMGPLLVTAWRQAPLNGITLVVSFYSVLIVTTSVILVLFAGARSFGPRIARVLVGLSAVGLGFFGLYQLWDGTVAIIRTL
jgi:threonine/homoserine/homoserine lactone efflux protein